MENGNISNRPAHSIIIDSEAFFTEKKILRQSVVNMATKLFREGVVIIWFDSRRFKWDDIPAEVLTSVQVDKAVLWTLTELGSFLSSRSASFLSYKLEYVKMLPNAFEMKETYQELVDDGVFETKPTYKHYRGF